MVEASGQEIRSRAIYSSMLLILGGLLVNYLLSQLVLLLGIPLFLDSLGTILTTLLGGVLPGMLVGFALNMINGISDPITLYYGIISVLLATATAFLARNDWFSSAKRVWLPVLVLSFIGGAVGSCLTWLLYGRGIGTGISAPFALRLLDLGIPAFTAQLIADVGLDLVDKLLVIFMAIGIIRAIPKRLIRYFPYRLIEREKRNERRNYRRFSLRTKVISVLMANSLFMGGVSIFINVYSRRQEMIFQYTNAITGLVDMAALNHNMMILVIKQISLLFGVALIAAMLVFIYCDLQIVNPINKMTAIADMFALNDDEKRQTAEELLCHTTIRTGDEIETMFGSLKKMTSDTNAYILHIQDDMDYISKLQSGMILSFADMIENRDLNTGEHIKHTATYVQIIASTLRAMGEYRGILTNEYVDDLIRFAPLHDIGKIRTPDSILNKVGKLTKEEFALMKTHTIAGKEIIERVGENIGESEHLSIAMQMAVGHHEWWDGNGYPFGLKGNEIPLSARIMAVADVYDALISKRSYKEALSQETAFDIIRKESGTHFDPAIVDAFFAARNEIIKVK